MDGDSYCVMELFLLWLLFLDLILYMHLFSFKNVYTCTVRTTAFPSIVILLTFGEVSRITMDEKAVFKNSAVSFSIFWGFVSLLLSPGIQCCHCHTGVSLITGLECGIEKWKGKWNGVVSVHSCK